jgi:hypothetical protein
MNETLDERGIRKDERSTIVEDIRRWGKSNKGTVSNTALFLADRIEAREL